MQTQPSGTFRRQSGRRPTSSLRRPAACSPDRGLGRRTAERARANQSGKFPIIALDFLGLQFRAEKSPWRKGENRTFYARFWPGRHARVLPRIGCNPGSAPIPTYQLCILDMRGSPGQDATRCRSAARLRGSGKAHARRRPDARVLHQIDPRAAAQQKGAPRHRYAKPLALVIAEVRNRRVDRPILRHEALDKRHRRDRATR